MQQQLLHCSPFLSIPNNGKLCLAAASVLSCTIWILRNPDDGCLNILLTASDLLGLLCAVGYGSYFGKKLDPEPGRCRRTDGKKWRCSKEAAPDSKYCERHMHRGRNRSRKPVETQLVPPSQPPATVAASPAAPLAAAALGSVGRQAGHGAGLGMLVDGTTTSPHSASAAMAGVARAPPPSAMVGGARAPAPSGRVSAAMACVSQVQGRQAAVRCMPAVGGGRWWGSGRGSNNGGTDAAEKIAYLGLLTLRFVVLPFLTLTSLK